MISFYIVLLFYNSYFTTCLRKWFKDSLIYPSKLADYLPIKRINFYLIIIVFVMVLVDHLVVLLLILLRLLLHQLLLLMMHLYPWMKILVLYSYSCRRPSISFHNTTKKLPIDLEFYFI